MTYCVGIDVATFKKGEDLDLAAIPEPDEVDAEWCLRFLRAIRDVAFATVDADGVVKGVKEGRVTITGENGEVILTLPEGADAPAVGEAITAYTTGVSTMSIPPQMNAVAVETVDSVG